MRLISIYKRGLCIRLWCLGVFVLLGVLLCRAETVGLVLSGGGAKGIAHIGVIKALEENDIPIDYVAGTSMGAIVGGFYACGYTPDEIMQLVTSRDFSYWSTGQIDESLTYFFNKPRATPQMLGIQLNFKDSTSAASNILPGSLINPLPMNFAFMDLFAPYTAECGGDFNDLFVPFRCVASDVYHKHKIVLKNGNLGDAIRASMTFPMVFKPIKMNGVLVYDGGIYDNFPVDVMHEDFDPDFIIGVSVSGPDKKPEQGDMLGQLEDMIIQNNDYTVPQDMGMKIQVPVRQFGVLDFKKAEEIYDIGYRTGLEMVDSVKRRVEARANKDMLRLKRSVWKSATPVLAFDSVSVSGIPESQAGYIAYCFEEGKSSPVFSVDQARDAYYRLISSGKVSDMRPQAEFKDTTGLFHLSLDVDLKKNWSAGFGGWLTSSTNSFLYLTAGYHTLSYNSWDASLSGWLGQSYYAGLLNTRFSLRTSVPSCVELFVSAGRRKYYENDVLFTKTNTPAFVTRDDFCAAVNYSMALGRRYKFDAGVAYDFSRDNFYPSGTTDFVTVKRDRSDYNVGGVRLGCSSNTLDNVMYPSSGASYSMYVWGLREDVGFYGGGDDDARIGYGRYRGMAELKVNRYFPLGDKFSLGAFGNVLATFGQMNGNFFSEIVHAPSFGPTPSTRYYFNDSFRSYNYVAAGLMPVWRSVSNLQVRGDFYVYAPIRQMRPGEVGQAEYGGWFPNVQFIGEVAAIYNFPFASLSVYGNYLTNATKEWNVGVAFGLMFEAPRFFR